MWKEQARASRCLRGAALWLLLVGALLACSPARETTPAPIAPGAGPAGASASQSRPDVAVEPPVTVRAPGRPSGQEVPGAEATMVPPVQPPDRARSDCPRLSSDLRQLLVAPDAAAFAAERGLYYANGRVRVQIQLVAAEADLAARYDLQVEARYRETVQALAPLASLCDLSNDSRVLRVESPIAPSPS